MKRILLFSLIAVLISPGSVSAVLTVKEYIPGEKVTLDSNTGNYWYWNLADFVNMTYGEQITAIAGLGTYGYIGGGWHMATLADMEALWNNYTGPELATAFAATTLGPPSLHAGRYDREWDQGWHYLGVLEDSGSNKEELDRFIIEDTSVVDWGAWVTTNASVVPAPGAFILAATGLLSSLGFKRWRRKH
jgi:hypothetical protein